jgi:hypothetical protein
MQDKEETEDEEVKASRQFINVRLPHLDLYSKWQLLKSGCHFLFKMQV